jgi:hypothetical protein
MHIVFYANHPYYGGLNNTGGSRTIVRSAAALRVLGHKVDVVACADRYTWDKHPKVLKAIPPKADVVVACSVSDIKPLLNEPWSGYRRAYWMRGLEVWQMPEKKIARRIQKLFDHGGQILCNSGWLAEHVRYAFSVPAELCYAGLDISERKDLGLRGRNGKTVIGCIYPASGKRATFHKTKRWDMFKALALQLGHKNYRYISYGTVKCEEKWLDNYWKQPGPDGKNLIYSKADIWFCPTVLEGFHNVGPEAALCGCLVVCDRGPRGGAADWADDDTAMLYVDLEEAVKCVKHPDYDKVARAQKVLVEKIGTRYENMEHLVEVLR